MTGMWTRKFSSKGFSLLEIIICLGLIATALMAVFRLQAQNLDAEFEMIPASRSFDFAWIRILSPSFQYDVT